jgi:hypothetical protein
MERIDGIRRTGRPSPADPVPAMLRPAPHGTRGDRNDEDGQDVLRRRKQQPPRRPAPPDDGRPHVDVQA